MATEESRKRKRTFVTIAVTLLAIVIPFIAVIIAGLSIPPQYAEMPP